MTLLSQDNTLSAATLAERIGITAKAVEKQIAALKADGGAPTNPDRTRADIGRWSKKGLIFGGSAVCRLPFSLCFKKRPPIENQNSIRTGSFLLSVCCFFLLYRLFRQSLVSAAVSLPCTDVKGKGFRAEYALPAKEDSARNGTAARPFHFQ